MARVTKSQMRPLPVEKAVLELSVLITSKLGVSIAPSKLGPFIHGNFTLLSILCHEIHERLDNPDTVTAEARKQTP